MVNVNEHYSDKCQCNNCTEIVLNTTHYIISFDRRIKDVNFMTIQRRHLSKTLSESIEEERITIFKTTLLSHNIDFTDF